MSKASEELEARWWWLDPTHLKAKCPAALAWETLRRTKCYPALWRKADRERAVFVGKQDVPTREMEMLRPMHLFQHARDGVGELCWKYLMNGFDPKKAWLNLDEHQRLTAQGYTIDDKEPKKIKISEAWTLPRQDYLEPPLGAVRVGICELARDGYGKVSVSKRIRGCESLECIAGTEFFQRLNPGRYLICCFDIRCSREELSQAWDVKMNDWLGVPSPKAGPNEPIAVGDFPQTEKPKKPTEHWTPDPFARKRPDGDEVHILPSNDPALVILLVPAKYNRDVFRSVFQGKLKMEQRDKWLPRCVEFWKTLTDTNERFPRNLEGTKRIELDARGRVIREQVVKPRFNPELHLPKIAKRGKSAARKNLWLGLAACDVVSANEPLGKSSANARVLAANCKSYSTLSNHQRTAEAYLAELEASLGRLDQNLAHWLR